MLAGPRFIAFLRHNEFGQHIREEGPEHHNTKQGTPTMGGLLFLLAATTAFLAVSHYRLQALTILFVTLGCAGIGFLDDFIKLTHRRSLGLAGRWKMLLLLGITVVVAVVAHHIKLSHDVFIPIVDVSVNTTRYTASATAGGASTDSVYAGRPFFIRIGVSHASDAPAASSRASTPGHSRGSRSSTFAAKTSSGTSRSGPDSVAYPTTMRSRFGTSVRPRDPAPKPVAVIRIGGRVPQSRQVAASRAAPVGVHSSYGASPAYTGAPFGALW